MKEQKPQQPGQKPEEKPEVVEIKTLEPKVLAAKMGISPKRLRAMLRADRPRKAELKGKKWEIPTAMAKDVEKVYRDKKAKAEADKKAQIKAELEGKE